MLRRVHCPIQRVNYQYNRHGPNFRLNSRTQGARYLGRLRIRGTLIHCMRQHALPGCPVNRSIPILSLHVGMEVLVVLISRITPQFYPNKDPRHLDYLPSTGKIGYPNLQLFFPFSIEEYGARFSGRWQFGVPSAASCSQTIKLMVRSAMACATDPASRLTYGVRAPPMEQYLDSFPWLY